MEFKSAYLNAMREQAPQMFNELRRSGRLDEYVQQKTVEAYGMLSDLLAKEPKDSAGQPRNLAALKAAENQVLSSMLEFPQKPDPEMAEPPDDLRQTAASPAKTSRSNPVR